MDSRPRPASIGILTPFARHVGGVESVNEMLRTMLIEEGYDTRIVSQDILGDGPVVRFKRRLLGAPRVLAHHFNRLHAASTDVVICNGEFAFGVDHPAAANSFHGSYYGYAQAMAPVVTGRAYRALMRLARQQEHGARGKFVIADSQTLAGVLRDQGIAVDAVIDNAIDTKVFKPADGAQRQDRCLFVGSPDYFGKGFDVLEQVAANGVAIDCVSSAPPRDRRLRWLGPVANAELPDLYSQYKALLFPSRFEGCGLVALEAMACGTPVLMTAVGAGPDIAREIPEFVAFEPREALSRVFIARLKTIERDHARLAAAARAYVLRRHGRDDWKRKWLDVITFLLVRRSGRRT